MLLDADKHISVVWPDGFIVFSCPFFGSEPRFVVCVGLVDGRRNRNRNRSDSNRLTLRAGNGRINLVRRRFLNWPNSFSHQTVEITSLRRTELSNNRRQTPAKTYTRKTGSILCCFTYHTHTEKQTRTENWRPQKKPRPPV